MPPEHFWVLVLQTRPQEPQLLLSVCVFTQTPEQFVSPDWQLTAHVPPLQTWPEAQTRPQAPQLAMSLCVLTQAPEQFTWPSWQFKTQTPTLQIWPEAQARPHAPQL